MKKTKFIFATLNERNGEQEYSCKLVREIPKSSDEWKWVEKNILKGWYDDENAEKSDNGYYFFGGSLHVKVSLVQVITKEEFDVLNKFL